MHKNYVMFGFTVLPPLVVKAVESFNIFSRLYFQQIAHRNIDKGTDKYRYL